MLLLVTRIRLNFPRKAVPIVVRMNWKGRFDGGVLLDVGGTTTDMTQATNLSILKTLYSFFHGPHSLEMVNEDR